MGYSYLANVSVATITLQSSHLSFCQSIKSNILTWLTELGTVNDPRLTGYEIL